MSLANLPFVSIELHQKKSKVTHFSDNFSKQNVQCFNVAARRGAKNYCVFGHGYHFLAEQTQFPQRYIAYFHPVYKMSIQANAAERKFTHSLPSSETCNMFRAIIKLVSDLKMPVILSICASKDQGLAESSIFISKLAGRPASRSRTGND